MLYTIALINILCVIGFCIKKRYYDNLVVSLPNWNIIFLQAGKHRLFLNIPFLGNSSFSYTYI